ncbi:MAG: SEL1-like repeat protein [Candidatus Paracaedibacteraceae bacterium]|nr:SEL1-like repeat protein [Candidatus Paracaedibacteraceae bacterium]
MSLLPDFKLARMSFLSLLIYSTNLSAVEWEETDERGNSRINAAYLVERRNGNELSKSNSLVRTFTGQVDWDRTKLLKVAKQYEKGGEGPENPRKATRLYEIPAHEGNSQAQFHLARYYETGHGIERDDEKAVKLYSEAAAAGHTDALVEIGACYHHGFGVQKDVKKAAQIYKQALLKGNTKALYKLGMYYYSTDGKSGKAAEYLQKAVDLGNPKAENSLGMLYKMGWGVEKDKKKAFKLFKSAADKGYAPAQAKLGNCYKRGEGVKGDELLAEKYYRLAYAQGYNLYQAGYHYEKGSGKPLTRIANIHKKAAALGDANAQFALAVCYEKNEGVRYDLEEAVKLYERAAKQGHKEAQFALAVCYERGEGVAKDLSRAKELYEKAATQGDSEAQFILENFFSDEILYSPESTSPSPTPVEEVLHLPNPDASPSPFPSVLTPQQFHKYVDRVNKEIKKISELSCAQLYLDPQQQKNLKNQRKVYENKLKEHLGATDYFRLNKGWQKAIKFQHRKNAKTLIESAWFWQYDKIKAAEIAISLTGIEDSRDPIWQAINQKKPLALGNYRIPPFPVIVGLTAVATTFTFSMSALGHLSTALGYVPLVNQILETLTEYQSNNTLTAG